MPRSDDMIRQEITEQLHWDGRVEESDIHVDVHDGHVTLSGTVPSYFSATRALTNAVSVLGVADIDNRLEVKHSAAVDRPTDQQLEETINHVLHWNVDLDESAITPRVENGHVWLTGTVNALWKKTHAEELLQGLGGVAGITNELAVTPAETSADHALAHTIERALARNMLVEADQLDVRILDGVVTLGGTVPSWAARKAACESVMYCNGVREIRDQMQVATNP